jgi:NADPH-dependent glutamate synthase beta subunit-like oxidoreductase
VPIAGSEFILEVDSVVPAIGQSIDLSFLSPATDWNITKKGTLTIDPVPARPMSPGIRRRRYDNRTATVVEAIGAGREGRYLHRPLSAGKRS